jgi:hypothetical protein
MSARIRVYPVDAILPADGFLPSAERGKNRVRADAAQCAHGRWCASARTLVCVRADAGLRPRGREKNK